MISVHLEIKASFISATENVHILWYFLIWTYFFLFDYGRIADSEIAFTYANFRNVLNQYRSEPLGNYVTKFDAIHKMMLYLIEKNCSSDKIFSTWPKLRQYFPTTFFSDKVLQTVR